MSRSEKTVLSIVVGLSLLATLANARFFFYGLFHTPKGMVYLGLIHFYEDYFFYLSHFTQGAHGAWLVANRFTSEVTQPGFVYWTNLMMGKIGGWLGLSPAWSYNLWTMVMVFLNLILSYFIIRVFLPKRAVAQLTAYVFSLVATSPMKITGGRIVWTPLHEQEAPHFAFDRLGGAPHHATVMFLFYVLTLLIFHTPKTKPGRIALAILDPLGILLLTITNPVTAALWIGCVWTYAAVAAAVKHINFLKRYATPVIPWRRLIILTVGFLIAFAYMNTTLNTLPRLQAKLWEAAQSTHPAIMEYLISGGPLFFLAGIGIVLFFISPRPLILFAVLLGLASHIAYFSPLPSLLGIINGRFVAPALYPFLAVLAVYGILVFSKFLASMIRGLLPQTMCILALTVFLLYSAPTIMWEFDRKMPADVGTNSLAYILNYLPQDTYDGFSYLSRLQPFDDVVLGFHYSYTDLFIPALTGHSGYSGHMLETINAAEKDARNDSFYTLKMSPEAARLWMRDNRIRYVVLTSRETNNQIFEAHYPFLREIYQTTNITIYTLR